MRQRFDVDLHTRGQRNTLIVTSYKNRAASVVIVEDEFHYLVGPTPVEAGCGLVHDEPPPRVDSGTGQRLASVAATSYFRRTLEG